MIRLSCTHRQIAHAIRHRLRDDYKDEDDKDNQ